MYQDRNLNQELIISLYKKAFLLTNDYSFAYKLVLKTFKQAIQFNKYGFKYYDEEQWLDKALINNYKLYYSKKVSKRLSEFKILLSKNKSAGKHDHNFILKTISSLEDNLKIPLSFFIRKNVSPKYIADILDIPLKVVLKRLLSAFSELKRYSALPQNDEMKSKKDNVDEMKSNLTESDIIFNDEQLSFLTNPENVIVSEKLIEKPPAELSVKTRQIISNEPTIKLMGKRKRIVLYASVLMLMIIIGALIFNKPDVVNKPKNFISEQHGENNFLLISMDLFNKTKLNKFLSSDVSKDSLVKLLNINLPLFDDAKAFKILNLKSDKPADIFCFKISTENNEEIVVLKTSTLNLIGKEKLSLSDNLLDYLISGKCYSTIKNNNLYLLKKFRNDIFVFIKQLPAKELILKICNN